MVTIVNNPSHENSESGIWTFLGVLIIALVFIVFVVYLLPTLRNWAMPRQSGTQINIPDKIDVNVNQGY